MLVDEVLSMIETAANRLLKLDPQAEHYFSSLHDKTIEFQIEPCPDAVSLNFYPDYVAFEKGQHLNPNAIIKGPLQAFLCWFITKDQHEAQALGLQIAGDSQVLEQFHNALFKLSIDWEELLARITNDELAHQVHGFLKKRGTEAEQVSKHLLADLKAYLEDEIKLIASKAEVNAFNQQVDDLRDATSRLEARITYLEPQDESN